MISKFITLFQVVNDCDLAASSGIKLLWRNTSVSENWHKNRDLRGKFRGAKGDSAPFKLFYLYVTATINSMKISFNNVQSLLNFKNYVHDYIMYGYWQNYSMAHPSIYVP